MAEVIPTTLSPLANLEFKPIIKDELKPTPTTKPAAFDPEKHLAFVQEPKKLTLKDISLPEDIGISPIASSEPFPLFTENAIQTMRQEIFTTEAWNNPKTLEVVSKVAGVDLIPNIQYEVGNINTSIQKRADGQTAAKTGASDNVSVTKWHHDPFPFVCVVMMSDATNMQGGETALRTGTGEVVKVRGPQMGYAVILQGRYVEHLALAAIGGAERITTITSFQPRDPCIKDDSVLTSIRPISRLSELYYQWCKCGAEVAQDRLKAILETLEENHQVGKQTDVRGIKQFLQQQEEYLTITNKEIVETKEPHRAWEGY